MELEIDDNFCSGQEVKKITKYINKVKGTNSCFNYSEDETGISMEIPINNSHIFRSLFKRISRKLSLNEPDSNGSFRIRIYKGSEYHPKHTDYYYTDGKFLVQTGMLYLTTIKKGGRTVFPSHKSGKKIRSKEGRFINWRSGNIKGKEYLDSLHYSEPPGNTTRIVLLYFVYQKTNYRFYLDSDTDEVTILLKKKKGWKSFPETLWFKTKNQSYFKPKYETIIDYCDMSSYSGCVNNPNFTDILNNKYKMFKFAKHSKYIPKTYLVSNGKIEHNPHFSNDLYFVKEDTEEAGKGIRITSNPNELNFDLSKNYVIQHAIKEPFCINNKKTSTRYFVLLTRNNIDDYKLYIYNKAYIIISDVDYVSDSKDLQIQCQNDWHCVNDLDFEKKYGYTHLINNYDFSDKFLRKIRKMTPKFLKILKILNQMIKNIVLVCLLWT